MRKLLPLLQWLGNQYTTIYQDQRRHDLQKYLMIQEQKVDFENSDLLSEDTGQLPHYGFDSLCYSNTGSEMRQECQRILDYQTYLLESKAKLATSTIIERPLQANDMEEQNVLAIMRNSNIRNYQNFKELIKEQTQQYESYSLRKSSEQELMDIFRKVRSKVRFGDYGDDKSKASSLIKEQDQGELTAKISRENTYQLVLQKKQVADKKIENTQHSLMYFVSIFPKPKISSYKEATGVQFNEANLDQIHSDYDWQHLLLVDKSVFRGGIPPFLEKSYNKVKLSRGEIIEMITGKTKTKGQSLSQICKSLLQSHKFLVLVYYEIIREANQFKKLILKKFTELKFFREGQWYYTWKTYLYERLSYLKLKTLPRDRNPAGKNSIKATLRQLEKVEKDIRHYWGRAMTLNFSSLQNGPLYHNIRGSLWQIAITLRQMAEDFFNTLFDMDFKDFYFDYMHILQTETDQYDLNSIEPLQKFEEMFRRNNGSRDYLHRIKI